MKNKFLSFTLILILSFGIVSANDSNEKNFFSKVGDFVKTFFGKKEVSFSPLTCNSNVIDCGYTKTDCLSHSSICAWNEDNQLCTPWGSPCYHDLISCNSWSWCQYSGAGGIDCFNCEVKFIGMDMCTTSAGCDTCTPTGLTDDNCNGIDDDCDGLIDDEYSLVATSCGIGECSSTGTKSCISGVEVDSCVPGTPVTEICDNKDNDCNNVIDDVLISSYPLANKQDGVCAEAKKVCSSGNWVEPIYQIDVPNYETNELTCNDNKDNDCDTKTDCVDSNCAATGQAEFGGATCNVDSKCCSGGCETMLTLYADTDEDDFGDVDDSIKVCSSTPVPFNYNSKKYVYDNTDCDDSNPNIYPESSECYNGCIKCGTGGVPVVDSACSNVIGDCKKCDELTGAIVLDDEFTALGDCKKCDSVTLSPIADNTDIPTETFFHQFEYFPSLGSDSNGKRACLSCSGMAAVFDENRNPANDGDCIRCDAPGQYLAQDNGDTSFIGTCKKCENGIVKDIPDGDSCNPLGGQNMCCGGSCTSFSSLTQKESATCCAGTITIASSPREKNRNQCCDGNYLSRTLDTKCGNCNNNCAGSPKPYCLMNSYFVDDCWKCVECKTSRDCGSGEFCLPLVKTCLGVWPPSFGSSYNSIITGVAGSGEAVNILLSNLGVSNSVICSGSGTEALSVNIISVVPWPGTPVGTGLAFKITYSFISSP